VHKIRGSVLLLYLAISAGASFLLVTFLWPSLFGSRPPETLGPILFSLVWYALLLAPLINLWRSGHSPWALLGSRPDPAATRWAVKAGVALLATTVGLFYVLFLPLSYAAPGFVESWILEDPMRAILTRGDFHLLANTLNLLVLALLAPFVEEVFFRGLLLPSWSDRFGTTWAVIFSSLVFAVFHVDIIGGFLFGIVTAVAFLSTRTLWLPIIMHITHNTLIWMLSAADLILFGEYSISLADFQSTWWVGLACLLGGVALLIRALWTMPGPRSPSPVAGSDFVPFVSSWFRDAWRDQTLSRERSSVLRRLKRRDHTADSAASSKSE
jgi:uncharacterized protein